MSEFCVLPAAAPARPPAAPRHDIGTLTAQDVFVILLVQQNEDVLEEHDVKVKLLVLDDAPLQRSVVQHVVSTQIQLLSTTHARKTFYSLVYSFNDFNSQNAINYKKIHRENITQKYSRFR